MQIDAGMGVRNYVLIRAKQRLDALEHMKFNILVKSSQLDRTSTEEVQKFNELLRAFDKLRNPEKTQENEVVVRDRKAEMAAVMSMGAIEVTVDDGSKPSDLMEENKQYSVKDMADKGKAKGFESSFAGKKKPKNMERVK